MHSIASQVHEMNSRIAETIKSEESDAIQVMQTCSGWTATIVMRQISTICLEVQLEPKVTQSDTMTRTEMQCNLLFPPSLNHCS